MEERKDLKLPVDGFFRRIERFGLALSYEDLLLKTCYTEIEPADAKLNTLFSRNVPLNIPFVSSPMDTVTEYRMAITMAKLGGLGIIHRNLPIKEQAAHVARVKFELNGFIRRPICFKENMTMGEVLQTMKDKGYDERFHSFPIINDDGRLVGLLTHSNFEFHPDLSQRVATVMSRELVTAPSGTSLTDLFKIMCQERKKVIPIIDARGDMEGMYVYKDVERIVTGESPSFNLDDNGNLRVGAAIGTGIDTDERVEALVAKGVDVLVIDTSHGDCKKVIETLRRIKAVYPKIDIVAGNIAEGESAKRLVDAGADGVRVGIGPGSICTTRIVTGVGKPQVSAVYDCAKAIRGSGVPVCADGGIKFSGHAAIALAAGAHTVMLGNMLAGTDESPGEVTTIGGQSFKLYRGMGSLGAMQAGKGAGERYHQGNEEQKEKLVPEGVEGKVPYRGNVPMVIFQFIGGLRSGMAHLGSSTIDELHRQANFCWQTAGGVKESHPHNLTFIAEAPNYKAS